MNQVWIRADGNAEIGLGHLVRCNALAQMLKPEFCCHFVCKEIPQKLIEEIQVNGFDITLIDNERQFLSNLRRGDIVVLDHYDLDSNYQKEVRDLGCKLVCIDDLYQNQFFADLIINHAPGISQQDYCAQPYTEFALGTDYALLRPPFLKQARKYRQITSIENVFICFGGSDPRNLTLKTLKSALNLRQIQSFSVVTGSSYSFLSDLNALILTDKRVKHYHSLEDYAVLELMANADLAIVPASGLIFEALAAGCVVISSAYVDNQQKIFEGFKKLNALYSMPSFDDFDNGVIFDILEKSSHTKLNKVVDGLSRNRILQLFKSLV